VFADGIVIANDHTAFALSHVTHLCIAANDRVRADAVALAKRYARVNNRSAVYLVSVNVDVVIVIHIPST
jgi:hypothetical protein